MTESEWLTSGNPAKMLAEIAPLTAERDALQAAILAEPARDGEPGELRGEGRGR